MVGAEGGLIEPGDDAAAAGGANAGSGESVGVANATFGEGVDVGGDGVRVAVAGDGGADVFAREPEDVGSVFSVRGEEKKE